MTKILDSFASNFQKGGVPFLIFIAVIGYAIIRVAKAVLPDSLNADQQAQQDIQEAVANQPAVKDQITTHDRIIADQLHNACDGLFKQTETMLDLSKNFTSASVTKRIFSAYGLRDVSILFFAPEKKNLISAIMDKYVSTSDVGKAYSKIFKNANLY